MIPDLQPDLLGKGSNLWQPRIRRKSCRTPCVGGKQGQFVMSQTETLCKASFSVVLDLGRGRDVPRSEKLWADFSFPKNDFL